MSHVRKIKKVLKSKPTLEGAGVHLRRAFGNEHVPQLDPFLLLDEFHSNNPENYIRGFPWHPHRGMETITYVLRGSVEHGDSMENKDVILPGGVQWMTAGSGIIHQEMPKGEKDGEMWGFQLWANLPASHKMMPPRYRDIKIEQIPEVRLDNGVIVKIICGNLNGIEGPVQDIIINPGYLDVTVPQQTHYRHQVKKGYTVFAYVIQGKGYFDPERDPYSYDVEEKIYSDYKKENLIGPDSLVIFTDGDELSITTEENQVRFILVSGKPIGEPVAWYGPVVMNTHEELRMAFDEFQKGTFLKHKAK